MKAKNFIDSKHHEGHKTLLTSLIAEPIRVQIPLPSVRDGHTRPGLISPLPPSPTPIKAGECFLPKECASTAGERRFIDHRSDNIWISRKNKVLKEALAA